MLEQEEKKRFCAWLSCNTEFSENSIGDVVSRITRINKIIPLHVNDAVDDFIFKLGKNADFLSLTPAVKSQLKRAYKLYYQFKNEQ